MAASKTFDYGGLSAEHQAQLRRFASEIHKFGCAQTAAAVEVGNMLVKAKADLEHGRFEEWCESEAGYRKRRAELLMSLANFAGREPDVLHIPVSAGYRLAAPSAPEHIIQQVLSVARDGGRVTVSWVEKLLEEANEKESKPERSSTSEVTKIAKLIVGALDEPGQATTLRKVLEAAGALLIQRFIFELQGQLQEKLHDDAAPSFNQKPHQQMVPL